MSNRHHPLVQIRAPFRSMDAFLEAKFAKTCWIGQIGKAGATELELCDQRGVLNKALIVFRPSGGEFARGIDGRHTNRIPAAAKARRTLP